MSSPQRKKIRLGLTKTPIHELTKEMRPVHHDTLLSTCSGETQKAFRLGRTPSTQRLTESTCSIFDIEEKDMSSKSQESQSMNDGINIGQSTGITEVSWTKYSKYIADVQDLTFNFVQSIIEGFTSDESYRTAERDFTASVHSENNKETTDLIIQSQDVHKARSANPIQSQDVNKISVEQLRELLSIFEEEIDATGKLPTAETVLALYESSQQMAEDSKTSALRRSVRLSSKKKNSTEKDDNSSVDESDIENFSASAHGLAERKRRAEKAHRRIVEEKQRDEKIRTNPAGIETKAAYSKKTGYWSARDSELRFVCFNIKHFGVKGAESLALFAKELFDSRGKKMGDLTRDDILDLYKEKYGALPTLGAHNEASSTEIDKEELHSKNDQSRRIIRTSRTRDDNKVFVHPKDSGGKDADMEEGWCNIPGVLYNKNTQNWTAKLIVGGSIRSSNFASKKYGYARAKQLAILAKRNADEYGNFPSRESLLKMSFENQAESASSEESLSQQEYSCSNGPFQEDSHNEGLPGVLYLEAENAWVCKWSDPGNREISRNFYVSQHGYDEARRLATQCRNEIRVEAVPRRIGEVFYDTAKKSWTAKWKRKNICFSVEEFGSEKAQQLAQTARTEAERTGRLPSKSEALALTYEVPNKKDAAEQQELGDEILRSLCQLLLKSPTVGRTDGHEYFHDNLFEAASSEELSKLSLQCLSNLITAGEDKCLAAQEEILFSEQNSTEA